MLSALCSVHHPFWLWAVYLAFIVLLLFLDLKVFHKKSHSVSIKEALWWSLFWFALAMLFNLVVLLQCGATMGLQFFTGYIIEKSLSVDNLFVILLIFTAFHIPPKYQHRVLFWGILGALLMRGLLIWLGVELIARFEWIFYLFGAFLVWTGGKMFFATEERFEVHKHFAVRWIKRYVPVSKRMHGERFFFRENGRLTITFLFLALVVVEFTDVVFAFDSIPAIFAITTDPFIVFTSNVFAILGLRSLYFVIAKAHDLFRYLKTGLAVILVFIGVKLILREVVHLNIVVSLGVVLFVLITAIVASVLIKKRREKKD